MIKKYRWSDGRSYAVEFEAANFEEFKTGIVDAFLDCRLKRPHACLELHVFSDGLWSHPYMPTSHGGFEAFGQTSCSAIRVHVINSPHIRPYEKPIYTTHVADSILAIGPENWHFDAIYDACDIADLNAKRLGNMISGVAENLGDISE